MNKKKKAKKSRIPNTQNNKNMQQEQNSQEKKNVTYAPKVKNNRAFPEEKITFRKLSISFSNYLIVLNKVYEYQQECLLKLDISPINEKLVRLVFIKIRTFTVSFLPFFNLSICIFLSSCNCFGISSNILKFVS